MITVYNLFFTLLTLAALSGIDRTFAMGHENSELKWRIPRPFSERSEGVSERSVRN